MSQYRRSTGRGSCPTSRGARSRTLPAMPYGLRLSLHSPQPTRPVSVSMRTNVHGRQPPSAWSAATRAIFIGDPPADKHARGAVSLPVNLARAAGACSGWKLPEPLRELGVYGPQRAAEYRFEELDSLCRGTIIHLATTKRFVDR